MADSDEGPLAEARIHDIRPPRSLLRDASTTAEQSAAAQDGAALDGADPGAAASAAPADEVAAGLPEGSPSTTLPPAAGEHVESLAEWIDERSEAAQASRLRRRAARRQRDSHRAALTAGEGPGAEALAAEAGNIGGPVSTARASRFPALPDDADPHREGFASEAQGLFATLGGARRRKLVMALLILAVLQLALSFRNSIASSLPFTRPVLAVLGAPLGLKIEPARSIEDLSIEGFEIQELGRNNQYSLTALIRNRSGRPLRWPAMELSLMDPSRNIVVRKVIEPQAYLGEFARTDGIAPRSEQPIRLTIETHDVRMSGYSVALFYP